MQASSAGSSATKASESAARAEEAAVRAEEAAANIGNVDLTGYATEQYVKDYAQQKGNYLTAVPEGYAKTEDIPTKPGDIGAQPAGNYLTEIPSDYATKEFVTNKIAEAELGGEEVDLSGYAQKSELPTKVSQLQNDAGYLTEHQDISGKLDASALPTAINTALAQAKASGEFDGKDGVDGQPGKDGYTPQKNVDYFDGKDGSPGADGSDGITPHIGSNGNWFIGNTDTGKPSRGADGQPGQSGSPGSNGSDGVSATHSWNGTVLTITSASGTSSADLKGAKGDKGDKGDSIKGDTGATGADGVSPTVAVSKSGKVTTVSITDKNGTKTATINDGADGSPGSAGKDGTSVTVKSVSESAADGGSNVVTFSDGKTVTIKNGSKGSTGGKGDTGATGQRGTGLLPVTTAPSGYTTAVGGITPKYRMAISTIKTQSGVTEVLLGDTVRYSYYHYPIAYLDTSYAYFTTRVSIRGATGAEGAAGADGKDYVLTEADKSEIASLVIEMLGGNPIFGVVDANNHIVLNGDLPDGTYSVKYEMDDGKTISIGNLVLDTNVYYTVTNNLTQCTNSNSATKVVQGSTYSATITAKSGYELKSVTVTMGGSPVTVSGGKINITNVTGNIVITAVAEEIKAAYTNILTSGDYEVQLNKRWSNSSKGYTTCNGMIAFTIPIADVLNKTIYFKGFPANTKPNNNAPIWMTINSSNSRVSVALSSDQTGNIWTTNNLINCDNGVYGLVVNTTNFAEGTGVALAINMAVNTGTAISAIPADAIMTINEQIA
jgi:hypothetical protein